MKLLVIALLLLLGSLAFCPNPYVFFGAFAAYVVITLVVLVKLFRGKFNV